MGDLYQHPKYYEIPFSYRDIGAEVDVFDDLIRQYSRIPVTRMLEVGCGPATHLPELNRRGYARADALPFFTSASSISRSSLLNRTMYFLSILASIG